MNHFEFFDPKKTTRLFHLKDRFTIFKNLITKENFPKVILLSGSKGLGKSTFLNHLLHFYFNSKNYDLKNNHILEKDEFYKSFIENSFPNILYFQSEESRNLKIDDIRNLKNILSKTSINNDKRFIILDDVENFNLNSLNALLKILEDQNKNNYFFLIDNKSKPILETIKSRCIEFKFFVNNEELTNITELLLDYFKQEQVFKNNIVNVTPGNFLKFNYLFKINNINLNENFMKNLNILLNICKNEKNTFYKDLFTFFTEYSFKINKKDLLSENSFVKKRIELIKKINNFFLYNLNQRTFLNNIEKTINE